MKIQLVNAPFLESDKSGTFQPMAYPPLGIMSLASYLRKNIPKNLEIKLTDGTLLGKEKAVQEIVDFSPDILGVSSFTPTSTGGYWLINEVKNVLPQTFVVVGGVHASSLPEDVYQRSKTDLVVIGEGEKTLLEIVKAKTEVNQKNGFENIPGLAIYNKNNLFRTPPRQFIQNLDNIPFPNYDLVENLDKYRGWFFRKQSPETIIMSTRGCPYHCFFCTDVIWKSAKPYLRVRSPKNVADELEILAKNYGFKEYFDQADEFNCLVPWAIEVCQEIKKRKLGLTWKCQLRADRMTEELARNLAKAGCWYVHLGVESANRRTLKGIGKGITPEQVEKTCKMLKKYGIKVYLLMMTFNIWNENGKLAFENARQSSNNLNFAKHLIDKGWADFFGLNRTTPYPGSPLFTFSLKHHLIPKKIIGHWEKWNTTWGIPLNLPNVSQHDYTRLKLQGTFWLSWYLFRKMSKGFNLKTIGDFFKRVPIIFFLLLRLYLSILKKKIIHHNT